MFPLDYCDDDFLFFQHAIPSEMKGMQPHPQQRYFLVMPHHMEKQSVATFPKLPTEMMLHEVMFCGTAMMLHEVMFCMFLSATTYKKC